MSQAKSHPAFEIEEIEPQTAQKIKRENNNLIGDLNPRFFEEAITPKQARDALPLKKVDCFSIKF
jgi:hypothetical protein